jgi:hypothetical protein
VSHTIEYRNTDLLELLGISPRFIDGRGQLAVWESLEGVSAGITRAAGKYHDFDDMRPSCLLMLPNTRNEWKTTWRDPSLWSQEVYPLPPLP